MTTRCAARQPRLEALIAMLGSPHTGPGSCTRVCTASAGRSTSSRASGRSAARRRAPARIDGRHHAARRRRRDRKWLCRAQSAAPRSRHSCGTRRRSARRRRRVARWDARSATGQAGFERQLSAGEIVRAGSLRAACVACGGFPTSSSWNEPLRTPRPCRCVRVGTSGSRPATSRLGTVGVPGIEAAHDFSLPSRTRRFASRARTTLPEPSCP